MIICFNSGYFETTRSIGERVAHTGVRTCLRSPLSSSAWTNSRRNRGRLLLVESTTYSIVSGYSQNEPWPKSSIRPVVLCDLKTE